MNNRTRGNGFGFHQRKLRLCVRKIFFLEMVIKYWNRLPEGVVESPSVETQRYIDVALRDMV